MEVDIPGLFETLSKRYVDTSKADRQAAMRTVMPILESWNKLDANPKTQMLNALKSLSGHPDSFNGMLIESFLFKITDDRQHLSNLKAYFADYDPDIEEGGATFMALASYCFNAKEGEDDHITETFDRDILRGLFLKNLKKVEELYELLVPNESASFKRNDRVVILTGQFLGPPHAPSVDALNYALNLIQDFNKQVLLIATSQMSHTIDGAIAPPYYATRNDAMLAAKTLTYEGVEIPFLLCGEGIFGETSIAQCIATVDVFEPEMILSIAAPSLLAEPFHKRSFCFIYPTGNALALTKNCYFHTYREPDAPTKIMIADEGLEDKHLFSQPYDLKLKPASQSLTREQFNIPEDAFAFEVVGMRLNKEVDAAFLKVLEKIVEHPKAHIIFAGYFSDYEEMLAPYEKLKGRTTWIGFQNDIMAVHNISDVFLNPNRSGGGTGVVYALQAALPVLSLLTGDGGLVASGFPVVETYDHMADIAKQLIDDAQLVADYQKISKAEAPRFSGRNKLIKRIMEEFEAYAKRQGQ